MELGFDKEIDALIRKKLAGRGVLVGDTDNNGHPEADELSAFAENAMPENTRRLHMAHLADCDRCRRILSNLIVMNAEAETAFIAAPGVLETAAPWYRKLFLFPNLAYVMGGLVLVFGGMLGFVVLQNNMGDSAAVSKVADVPAGSMLVEEEPYFSSNSTANATASNTANAMGFNSNSSVSANKSISNGMAAASPRVAMEDELSGSKGVSGLSIDGVTSGDLKPAAAPQPLLPPAPKDADLAVADLAAKEDDKSESRNEKMDSGLVDSKKRAEESKQLSETQQMKDRGKALAKTGPSRSSAQQFPNRNDNNNEIAEVRQVAGKNFQFRSGAWYDNAYRGQNTNNVRRNTDEYRKLDSGLRAIAESLYGTIIVVWKEKAFRIQ